MRVCVLGALEVIEGDRRIPIGGPMERRLLTALTIHAGEVIPESRLIDVLWGNNPPRTATKTLQNYVLRLRKALRGDGAVGAVGQTGPVIETVPPGYVLRADRDSLDSVAVMATMADARKAAEAGDHRRAASLLDAALASWRGPSLVEFAHEPFAMAEAARLDELRQVAIEERVDAKLALGQHRDCVPELEGLLADNPLRERRWGQLMLALYRSGRQAEALRAYQRARATLIEQLGIEPGPELRRVEQAVIEQDRALDAPGDAQPSPVRTSASPGLPPGMTAPPDDIFVGRQRHLERLTEAWRRAAGGSRQVVFVRGEAGIGKTSVARAIAALAIDSGGVVLHGRCDEEVGLPYQPFAEALRWYVGRCPSAELSAQIGPLGGELVRLVPDLGDRLPDLPAPVAAEPAIERYRLFEAVVSTLGGIASHAPVLLVLDDLHWAAKSTLLLLRHIVRSPTLTRLLVVATCRDAGPEVTPQLSQLLAELHREPGVETLALGGLDESESRELVTTRAGQELDADGLSFVRTLHGETGGNPFFMGEILRHLVETGAVYRDEGRWHSHLRIEEIELPAGVRGVVRERLSRLSDVGNRALAVAAVTGGTFSLEVLERVPEAADRADELLDGLDAAVKAHVVMEIPGAPGHYTFSHAIIRQVLCQELTGARRARLHQRVGEAYEALSGVENHLGALAHHFAEAGDVERSARYALSAALQAMRKLAFEVAVSLLEQGIAGVDASPAPNRTRRADLLLALADARRLIGDVAGAKAAALRAADDARAVASPPRLAGAAMLQAGLGVAGRPDPEVGSLCEEALAGLTDPASAALRVQVLARLALHRALWEGQAPAGSALAEEALALARGVGDPNAIHAALFARGITLAGSHQVADRRAIAEELVSMAEQLGNRRALVRGLRLRALSRLELGDADGFDADLGLLEREASQQRDWVSLSETARWRAMRALLEGRFEDVEKFSAEMLGHAGSDPNAQNANLCHLFFLERDRGRPSEALRLAQTGQERNPGLVAFQALLALGLVDAGRHSDARSIFDALAADQFATVPKDFTWPASLCLLATVGAALGDAGRATTLLDLYRPHAGHLVVVGWGDVCPGAADSYLAALEATRERWDEADAYYRSAIALETRVGARAPLVRTRIGLAKTLLRRGGPGDGGRAETLLSDARADADALGMRGAAGAAP